MSTQYLCNIQWYQYWRTVNFRNIGECHIQVVQEAAVGSSEDWWFFSLFKDLFPVLFSVFPQKSVLLFFSSISYFLKDLTSSRVCDLIASEFILQNWLFSKIVSCFLFQVHLSCMKMLGANFFFKKCPINTISEWQYEKNYRENGICVKYEIWKNIDIYLHKFLLDVPTQPWFPLYSGSITQLEYHTNQ